jgi:hypothetical protein
MATRAAAPKTRASKNAKPEPVSPKRWWEMILLYPTLAGALITAGPQWLDKVKSYRLGVTSAAESEKQAALWQKNRACASLDSGGYVSPSNVSVDATICRSGDILVRAVTPQSKEFFKWLPLDDVAPSTTSVASAFIPSANAATLENRIFRSQLVTQAPAYKIALLQMVTCTRSDGRYLHRTVQTPQGCFHEVIDTFTGSLVGRNPVPCGSPC